MTKQVYVVGDESRMVVKNFLQELRNAGCEMTVVFPDPNGIHGLPNEDIHLIVCMEEKMDFRIISDIANKQEKAGLSLYLIGSMGTISMEESQFLKSLPCACFTSYNIEIGKLMKLMEKNDVTKKRILVVDDEPILLRSIKGWLSDDFEVFLVNSGDTAIEFLNTHPVDLVLLDYRMPGMDGPDVLRRIRADVDFQNLPVMFLTANNDKESIVNIMHLEPNGYILKSMSPDEIKKSIKEFFKNHRYKVFS